LNESQRELAQVMELRMVIEPSATAIAAERARPSDLEELSGLLDEMSEDVNAQRFTELDESFHRLIVRATGNPLLVSLLERVAEIIDLSRGELFQRPSRRETSLSEHAQILKALYSRDPELANRAARAHLESVRDRIASIDRESAIKNPS
jgi:GntR family transcriptional repressor for pyruvate dehydrogenase complex